MQSKKASGTESDAEIASAMAVLDDERMSDRTIVAVPTIVREPPFKQKPGAVKSCRQTILKAFSASASPSSR